MDYCLVNKHTCSDKYAILLLEEIFYQAKVFSTLDLRFGYH